MCFTIIDRGQQTTDYGPSSTVSGRLLKLLAERGALRGRQIDSHFAKVDWRKTANMLVKKGVLSSKNVLPAPRVRPKYIRVAQLSVKPEAAEAEMNPSAPQSRLWRVVRRLCDSSSNSLMPSTFHGSTPKQAATSPIYKNSKNAD
jgi:hypothetical protein